MPSVSLDFLHKLLMKNRIQIFTVLSTNRMKIGGATFIWSTSFQRSAPRLIWIRRPCEWLVWICHVAPTRPKTLGHIGKERSGIHSPWIWTGPTWLIAARWFEMLKSWWTLTIWKWRRKTFVAIVNWCLWWIQVLSIPSLLMSGY